MLAKEDPIGAYTAVEYPPVIDAKPSDVSTIFTTMSISKEEWLAQGLCAIHASAIICHYHDDKMDNARNIQRPFIPFI